MTSRWLMRLIAMGLTGAIAACVGPSDSTPVADTAPDAAGDAESTDVSIEAATQIVALTSLTADIVHTLNEDVLVGIPGNPILRSDARFADLEVVSEGRVEPDLEKIVALQPDLVIGAIGFHDKTLDRVQELGIETLGVEVKSWDALKTLTEDLSQRIEADPQALLDRYDACLAQAPTTSSTALVLVSRQPLLSPNKNSWAGDFLVQFNIQSLTAEIQGDSPFDGYITLSEEKVLEANPETLLVVETENNLLDQLKGDAFWGQLQATQTGAVHTFEYFGLVNPGSLASIEATCLQLSDL
ncbi:MAG: ABC transporter substrate-binding protein [Leptolyngbya sp. SIO1D8]|nr:ABC transporter substrate-binding protein [Leptolyngbya sp. SIO1D8]